MQLWIPPVRSAHLKNAWLKHKQRPDIFQKHSQQLILWHHETVSTVM